MKFFFTKNQTICYAESGKDSLNKLLFVSVKLRLWAYGKFHMDLVNSLSIRENTASISPLCSRSGALSSAHLEIRAKPCCGPKLLGPNCATINYNLCYISMIYRVSNGRASSHYLRNTNGIPPRIAFLPSNTASLLKIESIYFYQICCKKNNWESQ